MAQKKRKTQKNRQKPTDAELEILAALWQKEPCTVREIHELLNEKREIGYTTVLKLMQIMTEKELVTRDESQRSHVYRSKYRQEQTQRQLVGDLLNKAFGGAADKLVMQALRSKKVTADELSKIQELLDEYSED